MRLLESTLVCLAFAAAAAQEAPRVFKTDVTVVNVSCIVRGNRGELVTDLDKDDFEIFEDGKKQDIRYFTRQADVPLNLGLLVDVSGSVRDIVERERKTAGEFLEQILRPMDDGMIV